MLLKPRWQASQVETKEDLVILKLRKSYVLMRSISPVLQIEMQIEQINDLPIIA